MCSSDLEQALLLEAGHGQVLRAHDLQGLFIAVGTGQVEIEVGQGAKGLHVQFFATGQPVKAAAHEVASSVFFKQAAFADVDARSLGHQCVGVFDGAVAGGLPAPCHDCR